MLAYTNHDRTIKPVQDERLTIGAEGCGFRTPFRIAGYFYGRGLRAKRRLYSTAR
jgi:hypothetical protein